MNGPRRQLALLIADELLVAFVGLGAAWTLVAHAGIMLGLSFNGLCWSYTLAALAVLAWRARAARAALAAGGAARQTDRGVIAAVLALALLCGLLSFLVQIPRLDDVNYLARAVYFLDHPGETFDLGFQAHAFSEQLPPVSLGMALLVEVFFAWFSWLTSIPMLDVYYFLVPWVGGVLIALAWFVALSCFDLREREAALGSAAICAFLLVDGVANNSFGNYAFTRIWHGKSMLMSIVVPLFVGWSYQYLRRPSRAAWGKLFGLSVAAFALTSTTIFLLPALAVLQGIGFLASSGLSLAAAVRRLVGYYSSYAYNAVVTVGVWLTLRSGTHELFENFRRAYTQQHDMVFGGYFSAVSLLAYAAIVAAIALADRGLRRYLIAWALAVVVLLYNPLVFPVVAGSFTTLGAYYRLAWALPFPLAIGLAIGKAAERWALKDRTVALVGSSLVAAALLVNLVPTGLQTYWSGPQAPWRDNLAGAALATVNEYGTVSKVGKTHLAAFRYKLRQDDYATALAIIEHARPGPMLAPDRIAVVIPRVTSRFPQVSLRGFALERLLGDPERGEVARSRLAAAAYVSDPDLEEGLDDVVAVIDMGLVNVVVPLARMDAELAGVLEAHGFERVMEEDGVVLWVR